MPKSIKNWKNVVVSKPENRNLTRKTAKKQWELIQ